MSEEKKDTTFTAFVKDIANELGEPMPEETNKSVKAAVLASKVYQILQPAHEGCLRAFVLAMLRSIKPGPSYDPRERLRVELLARYQTAPKDNMVTYCYGHASALRTTEKKRFYAMLEKLASGCKLNTH